MNADSDVKSDEKELEGKAKGKGSRGVPSWTPLAVERILMEFSDEEHPLTITQIIGYLKDIYGLEITAKPVRKIIADLEDFGNMTPKGPGEKKPALESGWELATEMTYGTPDKKGNIHPGKALTWLSVRKFQDFEVDFLADSISSIPFVAEGDLSDLYSRIQSLQSCHNRKDRILHRKDAANKGAAYVSDGMRQSEEAASPKPGFDLFALNLELLKEAIDNKRTVSFDYLQYSIEEDSKHGDMFQPKLKQGERNAGSRQNDRSPYRLQYMNDHYFLLTSGSKKTEKEDAFHIFRVDLIDNLKVAEDGTKFIDLVNDDAAEDYFRGAVDGFGGSSETIKLRCDGFAYRYVVERFSDFAGFKVTKPKNYPEKWVCVQFEAFPKGVELWVQKFLKHIEFIEPEESRKNIIKKLKNNAYGEFVNADEN